jgi:lactoylglutathione lyase
MTTAVSQPRTENSAPVGLNAFKPRISYVSYHVSDIERALGFYLGVLGMVETLRLDLGKGVHEAILGFPDSKGSGLILMWDTQRSKPYERGDGYSRMIINVSDVDAAVEHVSKHGARVTTPPSDAGTMRYAMVQDPDGYVIELLQFKRA